MSARGDSEIKFRTTPFHHRKVPLKITWDKLHRLKNDNFRVKNCNIGVKTGNLKAKIDHFQYFFNDILNSIAGKSRQGTITSLVPVSSNQNELEMIEKDGF